MKRWPLTARDRRADVLGVAIAALIVAGLAANVAVFIAMGVGATLAWFWLEECGPPH